MASRIKFTHGGTSSVPSPLLCGDANNPRRLCKQFIVACVCVSWRALLRPTDLFCKRGVVCGRATCGTLELRLRTDLVINSRQWQEHISLSGAGVSRLQGKCEYFSNYRQSVHVLFLCVCVCARGIFYISCMFLFATPPSGVTPPFCVTLIEYKLQILAVAQELTCFEFTTQ